MPGVLYTYPNNFKAQKIEIAAKYSGYELNLAEFVTGETNKTPGFLKKFPLGKVPAFEENEFYLYETNAIAYYVGSETTRGGKNEAEVLQWIGLADNDLLPAACTWVYPTLGIMQYNKQATETAKETVKSVLSILNDHLLNKTFLVGERVTQADITVACTLLMLYVNVLEPSFRSPFGNVNRWFVTLINQPEFAGVLGDVQLCAKMAQFDAKKFNEISGKGAKKQGAAKKTTQPKQEKQQNENKAAGDDSSNTPAAAPAPSKKKDPWSNSPKPSMDMDEWKRCYSNNEPDVWWKYFTENFKKEDYSIWHVKYKYNDELSLAFMAANLVNGMYQRLEKLRKHAFGTTLVIKKESGLEIEGVWFWLGDELAFELSEDWKIDYAYYDWKKINFDDENAKSIIKDFWTGDDEVAGGEMKDFKVYK